MTNKTTPSVAEQADERFLPKLPEVGYLGDDVSYGYDSIDMRDYALEAVRAALAASQAASHSAPEPAEDALCPRCDGEGTIVVMSDGGPDAYEVTVECQHCRGKQTLHAAYHGAVDLLEQSEAKYQKAASILYLGRANPTASKRLAELADYVVQPGMQADWLRARLLDLSDMAGVATPPAPLGAESKACASVGVEPNDAQIYALTQEKTMYTIAEDFEHFLAYTSNVPTDERLRLAYEHGDYRGRGRAKHKSDCAVHNEPAYPAGPCDCEAGS